MRPFQYDNFGRLTHQWRPGETTWDTGQAGVVYDYDDAPGAAPTWRRVQQRDDPSTGSGQATYLESWQFYDGLGRPVQSQSEAEDGQMVVVDTHYDERGMAAKTTVPRYLSSGLGAFNQSDWQGAYPGTTTTYDALGRVSVATNPDGTTVQHIYGVDGGLAWESVFDENGHAKVYRKDAFGRLAQVEEYEEGLVLYATTEYAYDVLGNLTDVWDEYDNHTEMAYNLLGQKIGMDDPDMGEWAYTYRCSCMSNQEAGDAQAIWPLVL